MLKGIKGLPVKREACVIIAFLALLSLPLAALTEKEQDKSSEALNNSKTEASSRNWEIIADSMIYNGYDGNYEGNLNPVLQFTDVDVLAAETVSTCYLREYFSALIIRFPRKPKSHSI